jgi:hypothetical protein
MRPGGPGRREREFNELAREIDAALSVPTFLLTRNAGKPRELTRRFERGICEADWLGENLTQDSKR